MGTKAWGFVNRGVSIGGLVFLSCVFSLSAAKPVGKFSFKKAPEKLTIPPFNGTLRVSDTMVAMAEYIHVLNQFYADSIRDTPSIFFVIDHSTSMSYSGVPNDPKGNRFVVTSAFIDTIAKKFPSADMGYAIFKKMLHLRAKDNSYFTRLPMSYDTGGAYLSLYKLNGTYSGQTGISILKKFLETKTVPIPSTSGSGTYTELAYTPSTWPAEGTNINVGFEAAKKALEASKRPKEYRYIIFLSDGAPNDNLSPNANSFEQGTAVPTTFTIYFTQGTTVPATIRRMTENIRANGYSSSNPRSEYWPYFNTDFNALMNFLMTNVYSTISSMKPAVPKSISVGSATATVWSATDSTFTFGSLFPLTGKGTPFNFTIVYAKTTGDTAHSIAFNVQTQAAFAMSPADFDIKLWERDIEFRHNGVPIAAATGQMNRVDVVFPWNGLSSGYKYTNVKIVLYTAVAPIDSEAVALTGGSGAFSGSFQRATSATRTPMNGILEHAQSGDAVIAVFRNSETPRLPLDTLRVTLPLNLVPLVKLDSAVTRDYDGDGYLDNIELFFAKDVTIEKHPGPSLTVQSFEVDSVVKTGGRTYRICLRRHAEPSPLETSLRPGIRVTSLGGVTDEALLVPLDGAPPVIGTVVKEIQDANNHTKDVVTVTMSEMVFAQGLAKLNLGNQPSRTFFAWIKEAASFIRVDDMFAGIVNFTGIASDSILVFAMTNNHDLNSSHWVNIQAPLQGQPLCDGRGNFPTSLNRKVRVVVKSPPVVVHAVPNPSGPSAKYIHPGILLFQHEPAALQWVYNGNGGTVITLKNVKIPPSGTLDGYIKIYDAAGNPVHWARDNVLSRVPAASKSPVSEITIYWNGFNKSGTAAAPGVYRIVVYLDYPSGFEEKDRAFHVKVGIRP